MISNLQNLKLYKEKVNKLIHGLEHSYLKEYNQFPGTSTQAMKYGKGAQLTYLDGNEYLGTIMGLAYISMGHVYDEIIDAEKFKVGVMLNLQKPL